MSGLRAGGPGAGAGAGAMCWEMSLGRLEEPGFATKKQWFSPAEWSLEHTRDKAESKNPLFRK